MEKYTHTYIHVERVNMHGTHLNRYEEVRVDVSDFIPKGSISSSTGGAGAAGVGLERAPSPLVDALPLLPRLI